MLGKQITKKTDMASELSRNMSDGALVKKGKPACTYNRAIESGVGEGPLPVRCV